MRVSLDKMLFMPLPVAVIGTYDENGKPNAMTAAWCGIYDTDQIYVSLAKHKTTENLSVAKAFTLAFANEETMVCSDYFGLVSGHQEDKIAAANLTYTRSEKVNAPVFDAFPLTLECTVHSFENGILIGDVVSCNVDSRYLDRQGHLLVDKMKLIVYDMSDNHYRLLGGVVGKTYGEGLALYKGKEK